jgi:hypothetical protein
MDFRPEHCMWCPMKAGPMDECTPCPRYRRHRLDDPAPFTVDAFCSVCVHRDGGEYDVFCRTNRRLQKGSGEDFDCYMFRLAARVPPS